MDASQLEAASPPRVPSPPPPLIPKSPLPLRTLHKFFGKAQFNLRDSDITAGVDRIFDRTIGTGGSRGGQCKAGNFLGRRDERDGGAGAGGPMPCPSECPRAECRRRHCVTRVAARLTYAHLSLSPPSGPSLLPLCALSVSPVLCRQCQRGNLCPGAGRARGEALRAFHGQFQFPAAAFRDRQRAGAGGMPEGLPSFLPSPPLPSFPLSLYLCFPAPCVPSTIHCPPPSLTLLYLGCRPRRGGANGPHRPWSLGRITCDEVAERFLGFLSSSFALKCCLFSRYFSSRKSGQNWPSLNRTLHTQEHDLHGGHTQSFFGNSACGPIQPTTHLSPTLTSSTSSSS